MEHGPGRVRMGTRRGTLSFIELPVDTGRRGYMICVPINIGCLPRSFDVPRPPLCPRVCTCGRRREVKSDHSQQQLEEEEFLDDTHMKI